MKPLEHRLEGLLTEPRVYDGKWLDKAAAMVVEVAETRQRALRMHRRCQAAEAESMREGRRADRMARQLRARLTAPLEAANC